MIERIYIYSSSKRISSFVNIIFFSKLILYKNAIYYDWGSLILSAHIFYIIIIISAGTGLHELPTTIRAKHLHIDIYINEVEGIPLFFGKFFPYTFSPSIHLRMECTKRTIFWLLCLYSFGLSCSRFSWMWRKKVDSILFCSFSLSHFMHHRWQWNDEEC